MISLDKRINETIASIRQMSRLQPAVALILGSGLGDFAETLDIKVSVPTSVLAHYPQSSVPGHKGALVFGMLHGRPIVAFQGRVHLYETGSVDPVCYPVRIAHALGSTTLVVTNAAGGINRTFTPGDLMVISDHINLTGATIRPSAGTERNKRMPYDSPLANSAMDLAVSLGVPLRKGIYAGVCGPSYETAAEVEMLNRSGADAVGMSTVLEVELASSLGMAILGISCITNKATGVGSQKLDHSEVTEVAKRVKSDFTRLLTALIANI